MNCKYKTLKCTFIVSSKLYKSAKKIGSCEQHDIQKIYKNSVNQFIFSKDTRALKALP